MAEILKFIYVLIIFLFLFLVRTGVGEEFECFIDDDCPPKWNEFYVSKCIGHKCDWVWKWA
ncbi:unnamed protein product [Lathyrus oleraceus]|uniref:Nodule-specific cysteine-rich peptide G23 n=1 Tax=Pisum sativum TaxID=3888 RepID=A0A7T8IG38_PEA|nr:nodule-specific cysteine-rich peptide G23 [Pisum sativum]